ncbi:MAG: two-component sensor histidine kinase [Ectothiorhodospiraceae bacterium]|nr:two-component sensor histidine kinase [Ectothiorhodospiraceae bacterium]
MRPSYSLRWALILQVLVPLLIAMALFTTIGLHTLERSAETRMQEDVELVARAVRLPISDSLEHGRQQEVRQALESVFRIGRVYGAYVYDVQGELVAAVGAVNPSPRTQEVAELAAEGEQRGGYDQIQGQDVYSYFLPLSDSGGRISGLLQVTRRASDYQDTVFQLRLWAVGVIAAAGGLITLMVLLGHRRAIGRHLERLIDSMALVESGQRTHRAEREGPREIKSLSTALNTMLDSIHKAEQEIASRREVQARLEQELRHAEKLAAIGRLASGVAHELGTPLGVLDGKAQRALRKTNPDSPEARSLRQIRDEVARMEHIVRQLLEFGRGQNRQYRRTRMTDLVEAASSALEQPFNERGVQLQVMPAVPDPDLLADPVRLEQVLVNLMKNAMQAGATQLEVSWVVSADDSITVVVDDDGPGVPASIRERLFEPFFTTKSVGEGTGLGLAVVHGIIAEHGGQVEVQESPMGGARFAIRLPVNPAEESNAPSAEEGADATNV